MLKFFSDIIRHTLTRVILIISFFAIFGASLVTVFERDNNTQFNVLGDAIWWVLVTMTTVGYGDKVPITIGGKVVGIIIMFSGVALLSLFTATVSSIFIAKKIKEGQGLEEIKLKDHLLICGWNFNAEQILTLLEKNKKMAGSIVLINQLPEENIAEIIHRFSSLKIKYVRGDYSKEAVLIRANIKQSKVAVILPDSSAGLGAKSDELTILSTLTIKSLNSKTRVYAYIIDRENLSHIRKAKADEVLLSDAYAGFLMASHILAPGVPQTIHQLCSDDSPYQLSRMEIPAVFYGKTYGELIRKIQDSEKNIFPLGIGREQEVMTIYDILSDDYSYLDQFIRRKFEKAGMGMHEENRINITIHPEESMIIDANDFLIVVNKGEKE